MVLGNYVASGMGGEEGGSYDGVIVDAVGSVEPSRCRDIWVGCGGHHGAVVSILCGDGADGVETSPQQNASNDQEQEAAGQPDTHSKLPASKVITFIALAQSAEHLALIPDRICCPTCYTQEVGGLGEEVG